MRISRHWPRSEGGFSKIDTCQVNQISPCDSIPSGPLPFGDERRIDAGHTSLTYSEGANRLLAASPLALMIGMLLDQQVKMEMAFHSPYLLQERLGRPLDAGHIASIDGEEMEAVFRGPRPCTVSRTRWDGAPRLSARRSSINTTVTPPPSGAPLPTGGDF